MTFTPISEWALYKYRFFFCYLLIFIAYLLVLFASIDTLPRGMSINEAESIKTSYEIKFDGDILHSVTKYAVDLPYHLLQKASIQLFGLTPLGVKLPSIILGALTFLALLTIARKWFQPSIAIATTVLMGTMPWLVSMARLGTPDIMVAFWSAIIIMLATYVSQESKRLSLCKLALIVSSALALYTPNTIYIIIAGLAAVMFQPHLRFVIRQSDKLMLSVSIFGGLILISPLIWASINNPGLLLQLISWPEQIPTAIEFGKNLLHGASSVINPLAYRVEEYIFPLISVPTTIIAVLGLRRLLVDFHSVRSYYLMFWAAVLIPVVGMSQNTQHVLFVPVALLASVGLQVLVEYWYRIFPLNPYARFVGFIPITILLISILQFNLQNYYTSMAYSTQNANNFSDDPYLAQQRISSMPAGEKTLVVDASQIPIYTMLKIKHPDLTVISPNNFFERKNILIVHESQAKDMNLPPPSNLLVNDRKEDGLRFRVFEN